MPRLHSRKYCSCYTYNQDRSGNQEKRISTSSRHPTTPYMYGVYHPNKTSQENKIYIIYIQYLTAITSTTNIRGKIRASRLGKAKRVGFLSSQLDFNTCIFACESSSLRIALHVRSYLGVGRKTRQKSERGFII